MVRKSQIKATTKYEAQNYDKVLVRLKKGERERIKAKADETGESLNQFIINAVNERIERGI